MAEVQTAERADKSKNLEVGAPRRRPRLGIRIDMTPMVDVAFLLLIFFMVTTVFRRPLAMEVNLPEAHATVEVPESNVLTVFFDQSGEMYDKLGKQPITPTDWTTLDATLRANLAGNPNLIVLAKIDRDAPYETMVDIMDALDDAHMERFSVVPMTDDDVQKLQALR